MANLVQVIAGTTQPNVYKPPGMLSKGQQSPVNSD